MGTWTKGTQGDLPLTLVRSRGRLSIKECDFQQIRDTSSHMFLGFCQSYLKAFPCGDGVTWESSKLREMHVEHSEQEKSDVDYLKMRSHKPLAWIQVQPRGVSWLSVKLCLTFLRLTPTTWVIWIHYSHPLRKRESKSGLLCFHWQRGSSCPSLSCSALTEYLGLCNLEKREVYLLHHFGSLEVQACHQDLASPNEER